jgi:heterodisulfide reductase subunit C
MKGKRSRAGRGTNVADFRVEQRGTVDFANGDKPPLLVACSRNALHINDLWQFPLDDGSCGTLVANRSGQHGPFDQKQPVPVSPFRYHEAEAKRRRKTMSAHHAEKKGTFLEEIVEDTPGGERIVHCLQCGSCGGSCPSGADMEYTPRALFALINAGERDKVLAANTMWACVSCYFCTSRCPQNIPITDVMYALKRLSIKERRYHDTDAPAMAKTFTDLVEKFGRSYEIGLAIGYHGLNRPFQAMKMGPMGLQMFARGRMAILPTKIRQVDQLRAIVKKAKELSAREE